MASLVPYDSDSDGSDVAQQLGVDAHDELRRRVDADFGVCADARSAGTRRSRADYGSATGSEGTGRDIEESADDGSGDFSGVHGDAVASKKRRRLLDTDSDSSAVTGLHDGHGAGLINSADVIDGFAPHAGKGAPSSVAGSIASKRNLGSRFAAHALFQRQVRRGPEEVALHSKELLSSLPAAEGGSVSEGAGARASSAASPAAAAKRPASSSASSTRSVGSRSSRMLENDDEEEGVDGEEALEEPPSTVDGSASGSAASSLYRRSPFGTVCSWGGGETDGRTCSSSPATCVGPDVAAAAAMAAGGAQGAGNGSAAAKSAADSASSPTGPAGSASSSLSAAVRGDCSAESESAGASGGSAAGAGGAPAPLAAAPSAWPQPPQHEQHPHPGWSGYPQHPMASHYGHAGAGMAAGGFPVGTHIPPGFYAPGMQHAPPPPPYPIAGAAGSSAPVGFGFPATAAGVPYPGAPGHAAAYAHMFAGMGGGQAPGYGVPLAGPSGGSAGPSSAAYQQYGYQYSHSHQQYQHQHGSSGSEAGASGHGSGSGTRADHGRSSGAAGAGHAGSSSRYGGPAALSAADASSMHMDKQARRELGVDLLHRDARGDADFAAVLSAAAGAGGSGRGSHGFADVGGDGVVGPYPAAGTGHYGDAGAAGGDEGGSGGHGMIEISAASIRPSSGASAPWLQFAQAAAAGGLHGAPRSTAVVTKVWNVGAGEAVEARDPTRAQKRKHQINAVAQNALGRQLEQSTAAIMNSVALGGAGGGTAGTKGSRTKAKYGW